MFDSTKHLIEKQVLEVTFQDRRESMDLPAQLAELAKEKLLPVLEKVMDRLHQEDLIIQIENLPIDLGELPAKNWEQEMTKKLEKQFERILREKLALSSSATSIATATNADGGIQVFSRQELVWESFLYFLKNGMLPGAAIHTSLKQLEVSLIDLVTDKAYAKYKKQLNTLLLQDVNALERFLLQFSAEFSDAVLHNFGYRSEHSRNVESLQNLSSLSAKQKHKPSFCHTLLTTLGKEKAPAAAKLITQATKAFTEEEKSVLSELNQFHLVKSTDQASHETFSSQEKESKAIYISNAGLVLLHPFLQNLFQSLAYTDENQKWKSADLHQRAVLLTQYLVTGEKEMPEYDLVLNKILCGYPLEKSLENKLELTQPELDETEKLLLAVIGHWQALKSTSSSVFRFTFLTRNGKLSRTEKGWHLQVEHQTWDVLLDRLPWSIGMIRNGFMPEWLYVDWR